MFNSLLKIKSILLGVILAIVGVGLPFVIYFIANAINGSKFPYYIVLIIFVFIYGLLCYVSGDIVLIKYKRKTQDIDPIYPPEVLEKANDMRAPFVIGLVICLLVLLGLFIAYLCMGRWPLL